jgi:hypothetical protein
MSPHGTDGPSPIQKAAVGIGYSTIALHHHPASCLRHKHSKCAYPLFFGTASVKDGLRMWYGRGRPKADLLARCSQERNGVGPTATSQYPSSTSGCLRSCEVTTRTTVSRGTFGSCSSMPSRLKGPGGNGWSDGPARHHSHGSSSEPSSPATLFRGPGSSIAMSPLANLSCEGGVVSPMLSNIFLHHVLDEWSASRPANAAGRGTADSPNRNGALKPIGRYPTGKGANWIEIVTFD